MATRSEGVQEGKYIIETAQHFPTFLLVGIWRQNVFNLESRIFFTGSNTIQAVGETIFSVQLVSAYLYRL